MSLHADAYNEITERILASLERGTVPWSKPWTTEAARNVRTGRAYRGINTLLLALEGRTDPRWGTFRAWKESGGSVRKGEHGTHIVLWKRAESKRDVDEDGNPTFYAFMRTYVVFNGEQCDGIPALPEPEPFEPIERAAGIIRDMPNAPRLLVGTEAFYSPEDDSVTLPPAEAFTSAESYYLVAFHELTHATGAANRLGGLEPATFGTNPYAREELVAEIGAAMIGGSAGISVDVEHTAAYIENWRAQLSADPRLIVSAAGESQRRADYVLNVRFETDETNARAESVAA